MSLCVIIIVNVVVAIVGLQKNSSVLMVASGAWALFFVGCGFTVHFDPAFVPFGLPLIGAFGMTILVPGLKTVLK